MGLTKPLNCAILPVSTIKTARIAYQYRVWTIMSQMRCCMLMGEQGERR